MRFEFYNRSNALGIGTKGLGGLSSVLDMKNRTYPAHAANRPVAMIPNCAATRHAHFVLDGSGPAVLKPPALAEWPQITWEVGAGTRRVNLNGITRAEIAQWKPGDTLLLSGSMLTGRDAAHKRLV